MRRSDRRNIKPTTTRGIRIEVCGGIASGKTSFARLFRGSQILPVFEDFRANPFWAPFYVDPVRFAFEAEVTFSLQHYHDIKRGSSDGRPLICDFSIIQDLAYTSVTLHAAHLGAYSSVHRRIRAELGLPQIIVHLECDADTELHRIRSRARREESSISIQYLEKLNKAISRHLARVKAETRILTINSARINFVRNANAKDKLRSHVWAVLMEEGY